jgi:uncharacterized protein (DUF885 family)
MQRLKKLVALFCLTTIFFSDVTAQTKDNAELDNYNEQSRLRGVIEKFVEDRGNIERFYTASTSQNRQARFQQLFNDWFALLQKLNFDALSHDEQVDYLLFKNYLEYELKQLEMRAKNLSEMSALIPFAKTISDLEDARRRLEKIEQSKAATVLNDLKKQIEATQKGIEENLKDNKAAKPKRTVANRAVNTVNELRRTLQNWFNYHNGYDPLFTWWTGEPYKAVDQQLQSYSNFLREKLVGIKPDDRITIIGDPIGREALISELQSEMITYTPEDLVEVANKEFAWCENEMKKASRELGYGDDWKKALEYVKTRYVEPGAQPELIRNLAFEAIEFVEKNNLLTVPKLARESWRMEMMSPERQLVSPFFLGGETIIVSYPTNTMSHEQKLMSMRGNNPHFSHATVHHELIPGHHLQLFMTRRHRPYRRIFSTPFWTEGWALYWEFYLWDLGFNKTPEDRIGALFWRMHRCARIIFSLGFHLEKMTPQECVDFLVERVGHERDNATAEVRRSFAGDYGPLYQLAYMMGGLQFRALHRELVDSGKWTNRNFHDAVLKENSIPVEMVRAILTKRKLTRDYKPNWKFYE